MHCKLQEGNLHNLKLCTTCNTSNLVNHAPKVLSNLVNGKLANGTISVHRS